MSLAARAALPKDPNDVAPASKFSLRGISEVLTEFIVNLSDQVIGKNNRSFVPMFGALFMFIFVNNLVGLIPGMTPATDNYNTTLAIGLFSFVVYNYMGLKENGFAYLKHFWGPIWWLGPLLLVIEILSHVIRPFTLGLRLMGNIKGDHSVVGAFLDLAPLGAPMPFYVLGLFVCFMQAFVFTLLSMLYVSLAIAHEEH
ncbi:MAG: F0F1 ATP synthase subunit A [Bdellovibrionales bacterium]|nr:F0F1 ATP synthase subunit A [Bdellovibrionales bacterium]